MEELGTCKKCGGAKSVLRTAKKAPYIGCAACRNVAQPPAPEPAPAPAPEPTPQPKKRRSFGTFLHMAMED